MLQTSTVKESTFGLLKRLQAEPLLATTRLVGGTALSLQIGHRESDDLVLFSVEPLEGMLVQKLLVDKYGFVPSVVSDNTLIGFVEGVKIAAMKMHAIINSGKRPKDFVDVAFLSMCYSYNQIKQLLLRRYPAYDPIMADKAIIYFGDIDEMIIPEIRMIGYQFDFQAVEKRIIKMTDYPDKVYTTAPLKRI